MDAVFKQLECFSSCLVVALATFSRCCACPWTAVVEVRSNSGIEMNTEFLLFIHCGDVKRLLFISTRTTQISMQYNRFE